MFELIETKVLNSKTKNSPENNFRAVIQSADQIVLTKKNRQALIN